MWSDVFYRAEQLHLLRLLLWAGLSIVVGTALLVVDARAHRTALLGRFAAQCIGWGLAELVLATIAYHDLALRDFSSASRAERLAWLGLGLYVGVATAGVTFALATWRLRRTPAQDPARILSGIGNGVGIAVQGLALALLELLFVAQISR